MTNSWLSIDIWSHRDDLLYEFMNKGYGDKTDFVFYGTYISSFAAAMIERPWLNSRFMEWVIVDSLMCNKVRQFGASILGEELKLGAVMFHRSAKGMKQILFAMYVAKLCGWFARLLLFLFLPIVGLWYSAQNGSSWLPVLSALVAASYLGWSVYVTIRAEILRLFGRDLPKTPLQLKLELWELMYAAYGRLRAPVVDPTRVKGALSAAEQKGAVWDEAVYAILNRVIARDSTAWVTDDSHSYHICEAHSVG